MNASIRFSTPRSGIRIDVPFGSVRGTNRPRSGVLTVPAVPTVPTGGIAGGGGAIVPWFRNPSQSAAARIAAVATHGVYDRSLRTGRSVTALGVTVRAAGMSVKCVLNALTNDGGNCLKSAGASLLSKLE